ncbi:MAG: MdtA/MuxA family multidrug efflux RND transporter periplasmic adaptor subunit, partial [Syntrophales bacterium LBB04]|nr:MdtA/MuxA family multidrug efflux RND transporter periplasmic adaptor subunit [Syntrophales bacterium LBB04]
RDRQRPVPVTAATAQKSSLDVHLKALGTVTPVNTVVMKSQVSGQLVQIYFKEGQLIKAGDVLAELDARPFQVQLMQAEGQLARDEALLKNAETDLARYKQLQAQDSIAEQQAMTQEALVQQLRGTVKTDQGLVAGAKLQISYTKITAPVSGRVGLRQVDLGNMIQTSDSNGLAVVTQLQPITVVFSVPQDNLPAILKRQRAGIALPVYAYSQDDKSLLASGRLFAVDNQIDTTTGTVKLKALFENKANELFANQFVNVKLKVDTLIGATVIPTSAIQRGAAGTFAYVVGNDDVVAVRPLQLGPSEGEIAAVTSGLQPGELVIIVGGDKLRDGAKVELSKTEGKDA